MTDLLPVKQRPRDAAADMEAATVGHENEWHRRLREGAYDDATSIQAFARFEAAIRAEPVQAAREDREAVARIVALHGLGTESGLAHRGPPNATWTVEEWERRILECVPERVVTQCYELTDAIPALLRPDASRGESETREGVAVQGIDGDTGLPFNVAQALRNIINLPAGVPADVMRNIARAALTPTREQTGERG